MMEDSYVETKVEALQDNRTKVTVTVDAKDVDARIKKTYKDFANKYNFPGFRKGKAPRPVIDNALGKEAVRATVTDDVVNGSYPLAIDDCDLYPIAKPEFEDTDLVESGKDYTFSFTIAVKPEFELSGYEPVAIELPAEGVTEQEIDDQVEALCEHYYTYEDAAAATKVKEDSYIDLAMKATDDKGEDIPSLITENRPYGLGAGLFPAEFDEQLVGLKKGQTATFTLDMPADAPIMLSALQGKTEKINFEVEVKVVKKKIMPEVNDEWVKETLGFEGVEDLRTRIAETVTQQKADLMPRLKENACLNAISERLEGEVPAGMVEENEASLIQDFFQQMQAQGMTFDVYLMQQGLTPDQFKADVKQQASDMAKQDLALDAWARHAGMSVSDEEVTDEFVKSGVENPEALQAEWRANGQLHMVRQGVLRTKAVKDLMDTAVVTELDLSKKDEGKKPAKKAAAKKKAAPKKAAEKKEEAVEVKADDAE
ncbi:trigger factor [Paraeggerthella hongkongensis]|uniref:Trigger factor n=1 Tax=Paraeggerthella hongkongensis TaxID=230658 RepID=A0A3N0AV56_9ACTN|nr:trigger factor [Paraeggerthella hongkongensis]